MTRVISRVRVKLRVTQGDVRVASGGKLLLVGVITGTLTVESGGYANIIGAVGGLVVEPGARVKLPGLCMGEATNNGGEFVVKGKVNGDLHGRSVTTVMPGAKIGVHTPYPPPFDK
ncbi:hypothetical protein ACQ856_17770 [Mycolicibacterium psychrotolerans]|uniref:hypothetical protein n=1 Tax=Mycolicibacterium psychrotolerans TaxID=216929 RepID=UPI003D674597